MNTLPEVGNLCPAAICALAYALVKSLSMPITSPVEHHLRAKQGIGAEELVEGKHGLLNSGDVSDRLPR